MYRPPCTGELIPLMATNRPSKPVRFAIVGAGWAGIRHLEAASKVGDWVDVRSVCDNDRVQLEKVVDRYGIDRATDTFSDILADDSIDVVDICTPHDSHAALAFKAIAAGKHVLVEKPIASRLADGIHMVKAAAGAGLALGVAEHQVYDEATRYFRGMLDNGVLGQVVSAIATWGFRAPGFSYPGRRSWLTDPQRGGTGTWMLQGIHRVAQLRALFGEVARIYAVESRTSSFQKTDIEGTITALMTMSSGIPVVLTQSSELAAPHGLKGITIFGERGVCTLQGDNLAVVDPKGVVLDEKRVLLDAVQPYASELEYFARHVAEGSAFPTSGEWELGSLAVVEAGYLSCHRGTPILMDEAFNPGIH